eukprot:TRINITY_DN8583_c0_g1_i1.p1 TRINITY_DN8583_c0_g1~~TRINITY_DN8583_c0_g1_i1.p1  ORF type:complete len:272 (+),score=66.13 TRINITY_DN8583_c0_g1_i1:178-993(+)
MEEYIVNHWLRDVYGADLPAFEVNQDTVQVLKRIFDQFKSSETGMSSIFEEFKEKNIEHKNDTDRLKKILESLYFTQDSLPDKVNDIVNSLASLAVILKSRDASTTNMSILLAQHMMCGKDADLDDVMPPGKINLTVIGKIVTIDKAMSEMQVKCEKVKKDLEKERESQTKKQSEMIFLQQKRQEYIDTRLELEQTLSASGFREEISHPKVSSFRKEVSNLSTHLSELRRRKNYYKALPLNLTLAKVKLEEAKLELKRLNQEIMTKLNLHD